MRKNIGTTDRMLRIILGIFLLSLTVIGPRTLWGILGVIPLLTAYFSFCPLYSMIGINTCSSNKKQIN
ncbi:MAG: DUF2892 domain-containing protein [Bacteriovorax sp.]|nr:DUF2892 domain-containing protein [Bacteriovorax sp.]